MALTPSDVNQGFRTDCMRLISQFEQLDNVRFEGFCELWTSMKFSLVFALVRRSRVPLVFNSCPKRSASFVFVFLQGKEVGDRAAGVLRGQSAHRKGIFSAALLVQGKNRRAVSVVRTLLQDAHERAEDQNKDVRLGGYNRVQGRDRTSRAPRCQFHTLETYVRECLRLLPVSARSERILDRP